jgi:Ca2+-binding EF-hand superfamily protein
MLNSGDLQEYKLNAYKDAIRRFGKDGNGTLTNLEFKQVLRFLEVEGNSDQAVVGMHELLTAVIKNKNHPIFTVRLALPCNSLYLHKFFGQYFTNICFF